MNWVGSTEVREVPVRVGKRSPSLGQLHRTPFGVVKEHAILTGEREELLCRKTMLL